MQNTLISAIAGMIDARQRNLAGDIENGWADKFESRLEWLARYCLPRGSGIDAGTTIDLDKSRGDKIVLNTSFHHMDDNGSYDGWTDHSVIVVPSFVGGMTIKVTGRDRKDIKNYLGDEFHNSLQRVEDWGQQAFEGCGE